MFFCKATSSNIVSFLIAYLVTFWALVYTSLIRVAQASFCGVMIEKPAGTFSKSSRIGGGICQISSTLYDAVVYANLQVVERHNHAFTTSYVGAGKDATVVYGSLDFQFKNTRKYPITLKASASNGIARIDIYGIKEENEYEIAIETVVTGSIPFTVIYEDDYSLPEGAERVTQYGMNGCTSVTYKIYKLNGAEVKRETLSSDRYSAMNKYISRGPGGTQKYEEPVPEPEPIVTPQEPEPIPEPEPIVTPQEPEPEVPTNNEEPTQNDNNIEP